MQNYVWGILTSLFILDIFKHNYEISHKIIQPSETIEDILTPTVSSGMKVKSDDGSEIKVEYEGITGNKIYDPSDSLDIKILYW